MRFKIAPFIFILSLSIYAASPQKVTHDSKTDFERGTLQNVSILSDGTIKPAPLKKLLLDTGEPFIWSMAEDSKGTLYLGTGNAGKLFKVTSAGDSAVIMDADELGIFALTVDARDNVYAATSPNGKVYKIDATGKINILFDPKAVYIWDLEIDADNNLLVATGDSAFIYKVTPQGQSLRLFQAEENHVRVIVSRADGTIYAGTGGTGYIYRLSPNQQPFVIYDTQMEEVNGLVTGLEGDIFASAFGESLMFPSQRSPQVQSQSSKSNGAEQDEDYDDENESAIAQQTLDVERLQLRGAPTSLFRITPEGYAKDLWLGVDEKIQSIYAYDENSILVGSGQSGKLMLMNTEGELSVLMDNDASHITALLQDSKNRIVFGTSNLGHCFRVESMVTDTASYISETIDAGLPAQWGTITWKGNNAAASTAFFTRSGNTEQPSSTWSNWLAVEKEKETFRIKSPNARFVQWKCQFKNRDARITSVSLSYIQKNLAPSVSSIIIHRPDDAYETKGDNNKKSSRGITFPAPLPSKHIKKGYRTVDWLFEDPNFDGLCFNVYYRRMGSTLWRSMVQDLELNFYTWDSAQMADGEYEIKVVAYDKLNNPEDQARTGEKVSKSFVIDNTGPIIETGNNNKGNVLTVRIRDELNPLKKVEYSIDGTEWRMIYPVDGILDSPRETFAIDLPDDEAHEVAIKASDSIENVTVVHATTK
ncbi:hypothetical protein EH223_20725 [candidate division KSB1 bacterium]|nr:hypothetical protein [candidate division KSB1 bacterium]RQV99928.1 MAG: hypothetical protein EH223_20725 [candidate division KSB1 bacterium]